MAGRPRPEIVTQLYLPAAVVVTYCEAQGSLFCTDKLGSVIQLVLRIFAGASPVTVSATGSAMAVSSTTGTVIAGEATISTTSPARLGIALPAASCKYPENPPS